jgi:hypothetical protein
VSLEELLMSNKRIIVGTMCQGSVDIKFKLIRTEQDPTTCILALRLNSLQKKLKKVSMNASVEERQPDSLFSPA